ncbi:MAG: chloride channel protein [Myxococcales bacterium]
MPHARHARALLQWLALGGAVGVLTGLASALFLWLLDVVTGFRERNEAIVYALPLAGLALGFVYERWGKPIRGGNNLVLDTLHEDSAQIPLRMAPMVLVGTVLTHLFGGSAGREGTAVQMGGSLSDALARRFGLTGETRRAILAAGMAGGFGSVFGTPFAGAVFGLEVLTIGAIEYHALVPALTASIVGDLVVRAIGVAHAHYPAVDATPLTPLLGLKWLLFGGCAAVVTVAFVELTDFLKKRLERALPSLPLRMFVSGLAVVLMWRLAGTSAYLGLGIPTILQSFEDPSLSPAAFALKLAFTAVTLSAGFMGGEVTPLFFVGATLGNALAGPLELPLALAVGVGLAAIFGAAANTPIALSIMAVELLGANVLPHVVIVSVVAYLLTGHRGIYPRQRIARLKHGGPRLPKVVPLSELERDQDR